MSKTPTVNSRNSITRVKKHVTVNPNNLFNRGRKIGKEFEENFKSISNKFMSDAIAFGYEVLEARPWGYGQFTTYNGGSEMESFRRFLKASMAEIEDSMTAKLSSVVAMIVYDKLTIDDVVNIPISYLIKMSYVGRFMSTATRKELLYTATTCLSLTEFQSALDAANLKEAHVEPGEGRIIKGSKSAVESLEQFNRITKDMGDNRPEADKLSSLADNAIINSEDYTSDLRAQRIFNGFCNSMRKMDESNKFLTNLEILSVVIWFAWGAHKEYMDQETLEAYEECEPKDLIR